ncbi:MAG: 50S ribosomal protein L3 N(5)-glutamine methyltransferase [Pseudomonadota bacterium]
MTSSFDEARQELATVRDLLRFAVSRFREAGLAFGHGTSDAYDEAAYLILHALHLPLDRLEPFLDARITSSERSAVLELLSRRVQERRPAAYLTGEAWLGDFRFYVDERVIVPRSFIAELLRDQLAPWVADPHEVRAALDLCTGSGCLAILLAHAFPGARVDASDASAAALEVAARNVRDYGLKERVRLLRSDLFESLEGNRYDVIVSNPPYVDQASMEALPPEYLHEPREALAGGADGLDFVRRILAQARSFLAPGGVLVVEIGHHRDALEASFPHLPFVWPEVSGGAGHVFLLHRDDLP